MTLGMNTILAHFASNCTLLFDAFPANVAKLSLQMTTVNPTMWNWILLANKAI